MKKNQRVLCEKKSAGCGDGEAEIGAVVEREIAFGEAFGGGVLLDAEGIGLEDVRQVVLGLSKGIEELGIAIGGEDKGGRTGYGEDGYIGGMDGLSVDDGIAVGIAEIGVVLEVELVAEGIVDKGTALVVTTDIGGGVAMIEVVTDGTATHIGEEAVDQLLVVVGDALTAALTIANEPYFVPEIAVDNGGTGGTIVGLGVGGIGGYSGCKGQ